MLQLLTHRNTAATAVIADATTVIAAATAVIAAVASLMVSTPVKHFIRNLYKFVCEP